MATEKHIEIERKYLLEGVPAMPQAEIWTIEQGYFFESAEESAATSPTHLINNGRLRRVVYPDQSTRYFHTIKTGAGVQRCEYEREISAEEFDRAWPGTINKRLMKTRYRVREGTRVWEVDMFSAINLAIAEIELESADATFDIPAWLKPHIVREVTDEPDYTNASIAVACFQQQLRKRCP
jgi:CYTH domain-containing protein